MRQILRHKMTKKQTGKTNAKRPKTSEINDDRNSYSNANVEQITRCRKVGKNENKGFDSSVCLRVISCRWKLADTDGISAKAAIDGLVKKGLLKDDSTLYVEEVTHAQIKIRHNQKEKTVIEIWGDSNA